MPTLRGWGAFAARQRVVSPGRRGGRLRPPFSFFKRKRAAAGPKENFLTGRDSFYPFNRVFSGFRRNQSPPCSWPRAFRFTRRYSGGRRNPGSRGTGRQRRRAAQVSEAAEADGSTRSMAMVVSDPSIRYPCAARILQAILMTAPVNSRGFLGGGGLCSPPQAGEQAGRQSPKRVFGYFLHGQKVPLRRKAPPRSASSGGKSRSRPETRNVSLPPAGTAGELRSSALEARKEDGAVSGRAKAADSPVERPRRSLFVRKSALFFWTGGQ